jgi:hypothetical protein
MSDGALFGNTDRKVRLVECARLLTEAARMKLRIRGNSIRIQVSNTELAKIAQTGSVEETVRFSSEQGLRYGIEVRPTGAVTAMFSRDAIIITVPKPRLDLWLRANEVSVEGSQPIGGGKVLQIVLEKDDSGAARSRGDT